MNTATNATTASPASASASAPPPLVLKPSYSPPTDPGAMAPRLEGDVKSDLCICGEPPEDDLPYCSFQCEDHAKYLEEMDCLAAEGAKAMAQKAQAQKTQAQEIEDACMVCGKPAEDGLPFCSLACECHARYEEDQQWQAYQAYQAAKMKEAQQALETQKAEGH